MLYVFGDSFVEDYRFPDWTWAKSISKSLNIDYRNFAQGATSLDYTYGEFERQHGNFVPGDILIVGITNEDRFNFFPDRRYLSTLWAFDNHMHRYLPEEKTAVEYYLKYLDNPADKSRHLINFLHNVQDITVRKSLRTVVIQTMGLMDYTNSLLYADRFDKLYIATGTLHDISRSELANDLNYDISHDKNGVDMRHNHMCKSNHQILSNKIIKHLTDREPIDLTVGFNKKIITLDIKKATNWYELI